MIYESTTITTDKEDHAILTNRRQVIYFSIDETLDMAVFSRLLGLISKEKRERIKHLYFDIDKKLSLYAELLVRLVAYQAIGVGNSKLDFGYSRFGKPYVKGCPEFNFNISHTKEAVVVSTSLEPIGVDIERIRRFDLRLMNRFFTLSEREYIKKEGGEVNKRFYEIWTKKESYLKYIGSGLCIPLGSFDVLSEGRMHKFKTFKKDEYIVSVCSKDINEGCVWVEIEENKITEMAMDLLK